jgi:hypothetical protein
MEITVGPRIEPYDGAWWRHFAACSERQRDWRQGSLKDSCKVFRFNLEFTYDFAGVENAYPQPGEPRLFADPVATVANPPSEDGESYAPVSRIPGRVGQGEMQALTSNSSPARIAAAVDQQPKVFLDGFAAKFQQYIVICNGYVSRIRYNFRSLDCQEERFLPVVCAKESRR